MPLTNTKERYGSAAQYLHWATAALILTLIPLGMFMHELPAETTEQAERKFWFYSLHKTIGLAAFAIASLRVAWAIFQPHPRPLNGSKPFEALAAQTVHWTLYGCIILMPLTGWIHHAASTGFAPIWWPGPQTLPFVPKDPGVASFFGAAHFFIGVLLIVSLILHIGGAVKHAAIDRDATLARMIPGAEPPLPDDLPKPRGRRLSAGLAIMCLIGAGGAAAAVTLLGGTTASQSFEGDRLSARDATVWIVDADASRLAIEVRQSKDTVVGSFANWRASIAFDADALEASEIVVDVDVGSIALGALTEQAVSAAFLNAAAFPTAVFRTSEFEAVGDGVFIARGTLELNGRSNPLDLPFSLEIAEGRAFAEGEVSLQRLAFGVGQEGYATGEMVGLDVTVRFSIEADRAR